MYAAPTEASWSRSAKLTEFQRVKEAVRRLEHTAREQLALERESQNVFDFLKAEITRIKRSIGALSSVVDEELVSLRGECAALRDEVARAVDLAKSQTDSAVELIAEARKRDTEWMQTSFSQVKDSVARLEAESKETRKQLLELAASHASAAARREADAASSSSAQQQAIDALQERFAERSGAVEASCKALAAENGTRRDESVHLARLATEANTQIERLTHGLRTVHSSVEALQAKGQAERAAAQEEQQKREQAAGERLAEAQEGSARELARHRDAISLLVETVDSLTRESKAGDEALGGKLAEAAEEADSRGAAHERALRQQEAAVGSLSTDVDAVSDAVRRLEARLGSQAEQLLALQEQQADLKAQLSQAQAALRTIKASAKDAAESLVSHKTQSQRALDDLVKRSEGFSKAAAVFADALKVPNPLGGALPMPRRVSHGFGSPSNGTQHHFSELS